MHQLFTKHRFSRPVEMLPRKNERNLFMITSGQALKPQGSIMKALHMIARWLSLVAIWHCIPSFAIAGATITLSPSIPTTTTPPQQPRFGITMTGQTSTDANGNTATDVILTYSVEAHSYNTTYHDAYTTSYSGFWSDPRGALNTGTYNYTVTAYGFYYVPYNWGWIDGHEVEEHDNPDDRDEVTGTHWVDGHYDAGFETYSGTLGTASLQFNLFPTPPEITSAGFQSGVVGYSLNYSITASNAPSTYNVSGALPTGLSLSSVSGLISGTPGQAGTFNVTIGATNSGGTGTKTLTLVISPPSAPRFEQQPLSTVVPTLADGLLSASGGTSFVVKQDGSLWGWGENGVFGVVGDGSTTNRILPVNIASGVKSTAPGRLYHSSAIKTDGTGIGWGYNNASQIGDGTRINRMTPVPISSFSDISALVGGGYLGLGLKSTSSLWHWSVWTTGGVPALLTNINGFTKISAGHVHNLALKADGTVWSWGSNSDGQLGDGTTADRETPGQVAGLTNVVAIGAGEYHSIAVKADGTVWSWGYNDFGCLGDGTTTRRLSPVQVIGLTGVASIACGAYHNVALKTNGTVWAWGRNMGGGVGDGTTSVRASPVEVVGITDVVAIACGGGHSLALKSDGTLRAWGPNGAGQLGDGTTVDRYYPVQVYGINNIGATSNTVAFIVNVSGAPVPTLQWQRKAASQTDFVNISDGIIFTGTTTAKLVVRNLSGSMDGDQYRCVATNSLGTAVSVETSSYLYSQPPTFAMLSGNKQIGFVSQYNTNPYDVAVWTTSGSAPLPNVPVTFRVTDNLGKVGMPNTSLTPREEATVFTDRDGTARMYYQHPSVPGANREVRVSAGNSQVTFLSTTASGPQIVVQPVNTKVYQNSVARFNVAAVGAGALLYQWKKSGLNLAGATKNYIDIRSAQPSDAGNYTVLVTDMVGSTLSSGVALEIISSGITASQSATTASYSPGIPITVNVVINLPPNGASAVAWRTHLPAGWRFLSSTGDGQVKPLENSEGQLEWAWDSKVGPVSFSYTMGVYPGAVGTFQIEGEAYLRESGQLTRLSAAPLIIGDGFPSILAPSVAISMPSPLNVLNHSTDTDLDWAIDLRELTRTMELFSTKSGGVRTGRYLVQTGTEDGFSGDPITPANVPVTLSRYHSADINKDGMISEAELASIKVLYNRRQESKRTGAYRADALVGGYAPGVPSGVTQIVAHPSPQFAWTGQSVSFSVNGDSGSGGFQYLWQRRTAGASTFVSLIDSTTYTGVWSPTLQIASVSPSMSGDEFRCIVSANGNPATSQSASLTVEAPIAVSILTNPANQSAVSGANALFSIVANGTPKLIYQWQRRANGAIDFSDLVPSSSYSGVRSSTLSVNGVTAAMTGDQFRCIVNNIAGAAATSTSAVLTVIQPPLITSSNNTTFTAAVNGNFAFTASGTAPITFQISTGALPTWATLNPSTGVLSGIPPSASGSPFSFGVTAMNAAGTSPIQTFTLSVLQPPVITSASATDFAIGDTTVFRVTASGMPAPTFTASGLPSWANLDGSTGAIVGTPMNSSGAPFNVTLTAMNGALPNDVSTLTINVTSGAPTITRHPTATSAIVGSQASFSAAGWGDGTLTYQWRKNGGVINGSTQYLLIISDVQSTDAGSYDVVITDSRGSAISSPATLTIQTPVSILSQTTDQTVPRGSSTTLSVSASGDEPLTYQWSRNGNPINGAVAPALTLSAVELVDDGIYAVSVTNAFGSIASEPIVLTVSESPQITQQPQSKNIESGESAVLSAHARGNPAVTYQWYSSGSAISGATDAAISVQSAGSYHLVATNAIGTVSSNVAVVTVGSVVRSVPTISVPPASISATYGSDIALHVHASGRPAPAYQWYRNGSSIIGATNASLMLPNVTAADAGAYTVTVTNALGNVTSSPANVQVSSVGTQTQFEYSLWSLESSEGFNVGPIGGQNGWTTVFGDANEAIITTDQAISGQSSIKLLGASGAEVQPSYIPNNVVGNATFYDVRMRLKASMSPDAGAYAQNPCLIATLVKVGSVGIIYTKTPGSNWSQTTATVPLDSNDMAEIRITTRVAGPFSSSTVDLWVNSQPIAFDWGVGPPYFNGIRFYSPPNIASWFDDLYVGIINPLFSDLDQSGLSDSYEIDNDLVGLGNVRATDFDNDGLTTLQESIYNTKARVWDTDGDGLGDGAEVLLHGTNPNKRDTDDDGLPDAWEVAKGLSPLSAVGINGAVGDGDGDGLSNFQEFFLMTDPNAADSDGDGVPDGTEVLAGADPTSPTSVGRNPSASETASVTFRWGDPSGSHSEKWILVIEPSGKDSRPPFRIPNQQFGQEDTATVKLIRGGTYTIRLEHLETNRSPQPPDFDWSLTIDGKTSGVIQGGWIIDNSEGLLTTLSGEGGTTNLAVAKKARLVAQFVHQVRFSGSNYHIVRTDDATLAYTVPHWVDSNGDGQTNGSSERNYPVAFTMGSTIRVGAKFFLGTPIPSGQTVSVRATSTLGGGLAETTATTNQLGMVTLQETPLSAALPNVIRFFNSSGANPFSLNWEIRIGSGDWLAAGITRHTVYVTRSNPTLTANAMRFETLFNIGCRNADGLGSNEQQVVDAIFAEFADLHVARVVKGTGALENSSMTYWIGGDPSNTTGGLLNSRDGRCEAWGAFLVDVLRTQGINSQPTVYIPPYQNGTLDSVLINELIARQPNFSGQVALIPEFYVKNWDLNGDKFFPVKLSGVAAQGDANNNPPCLFRNHVVVVYGAKVYDPSYGQSYAGRASWEDASLDGFGAEYRTMPNPNFAIGGPGPSGLPWRVFVWKKDTKGVVETTLEVITY